MARTFAKSFYNSKEWEQVRNAVLMRDCYLCTKCGKPAAEVHHIIHLSPKNIDDPNITMNMDNLTSLCKDCHFEEHRGEHGKGRVTKEQMAARYEFDENGYLVEVAPVQQQDG
jgi:5-methylcytosine-specific restriction endonuclease McrA